jgi:hypothetical protein
MSNFMKTRPVRAEGFFSFRCEESVGQTNIKKIIVAFRKFANAPKNNVTNSIKNTFPLFIFIQNKSGDWSFVYRKAFPTRLFIECQIHNFDVKVDCIIN